jgi:hypothetical protein
MSKKHPWATTPSGADPIMINSHGKSLIDEKRGLCLYVRGRSELAAGMECCLIQ